MLLASANALKEAIVCMPSDMFFQITYRKTMTCSKLVRYMRLFERTSEEINSDFKRG